MTTEGWGQSDVMDHLRLTARVPSKLIIRLHRLEETSFQRLGGTLSIGTHWSVVRRTKPYQLPPCPSPHRRFGLVSCLGTFLSLPPKAQETQPSAERRGTRVTDRLPPCGTRRWVCGPPLGFEKLGEKWACPGNEETRMAKIFGTEHAVSNLAGTAQLFIIYEPEPLRHVRDRRKLSEFPQSDLIPRSLGEAESGEVG
jgi:hypothetical protein